MIVLGNINKHTIKISESQYRLLHLLNEHNDVVNNFDLAKRIILETWETPEDFWYVSISQRMKDNYNVRDDDGREIFRQKKFAGTSYKVNQIGYAIIQGQTRDDAVNSLFNSVVHILPQWINTVGSKTVNSIINACEMMNARAYMKSEKKNINDELNSSKGFKPNGVTPKDIKMLCGNTDDNSVKVIMNYRMNRSDRNSNMALVDCDIDDDNSLNKVLSMLNDFNIKPYECTPSHNGYHILFDKRQISSNKTEIKNTIAQLNQRFGEIFGEYTNKQKRTNGMKRGQESQVEIGNHSNILLYSAAGDTTKNVTSPQWNKGKVYPYPDQRLKPTLKESKRLIQEGLSDILYHFTTIKVLYNIISTNSMICSSVYSNTRDRLINSDYPFYISFTRQHNNNFGYVQYMNQNSSGLQNKLNVRIEFDGRLLGGTYKGNAVNYHNIENRNNRQQREANGDALKLVTIRQSEDRLFSNTPIISNIDKYITRIDILIPHEYARMGNNPTLNYVGRILRNPLFKDRIFVYYNERDFNLPNSNNFINDKILNYIRSSNMSQYILGNADNKEFRNTHKLPKGRNSINRLPDSTMRYISGFVAILSLNQKRIGLKEYSEYAVGYMLQDYKKTLSEKEYIKDKETILKCVSNYIETPNLIKNFSFNFFVKSLSNSFRIIYARAMLLLHEFLKGQPNVNFSALRTNAARQISSN